MLVDMSKITLDNLNEFWNIGKPKVKGLPRGRNAIKRSEDEKKKYIKEYQHNYYLNVTKPKRQENRR